MDTPTILTLLSVFVVICFIGIAVFFITKRLVLSNSTGTRSLPSDKFRPAEPTSPYRESDVHYGERTFYDSALYDVDSGKIRIVDLPKKGSEQENDATRFWEPSIAPDATCLIKGRSIVECLKDCDCGEREELLQKLRGRVQ